MSPHTQGRPGTRHTVITVETENKKEEKTKGGNGWEAENLESITTEEKTTAKRKQRLRYPLRNVVPNRRYSETV